VCAGKAEVSIPERNQAGQSLDATCWQGSDLGIVGISKRSSVYCTEEAVMRMTRDTYAKEVLRVIESLDEGVDHIYCPRENCESELQVLVSSLKAGAQVVCPDHGIIFRD
jgi:hypothetical protein